MTISIGGSPVSMLMSLLSDDKPQANSASSDATEATDDMASTASTGHGGQCHHRAGGSGGTSFADMLSALTGQGAAAGL